MSDLDYIRRCNPKHLDFGELVCAVTDRVIDSLAYADEARRSFRRVRRERPDMLGDLILVRRTVAIDDDYRNDRDESFLVRVRPTFTTALDEFRLSIALRLRWERSFGHPRRDWRTPPWRPTP
jgi:hypothetical protein